MNNHVKTLEESVVEHLRTYGYVHEALVLEDVVVRKRHVVSVDTDAPETFPPQCHSPCGAAFLAREGKPYLSGNEPPEEAGLLLARYYLRCMRAHVAAYKATSDERYAARARQYAGFLTGCNFLDCEL